MNQPNEPEYPPHPDEDWFLSDDALRQMFEHDPTFDNPFDLDTDEYGLEDPFLDTDGFIDLGPLSPEEEARHADLLARDLAAMAELEQDPEWQAFMDELRDTEIREIVEDPDFLKWIEEPLELEPNPNSNVEPWVITQRGHYSQSDDHFAYLVSNNVDYTFQAKEIIQTESAIYAVQAVKTWETPSQGATETSAVTLGYYEEAEEAVSTLNHLTRTWNSGGLEAAMSEASQMADAMGTRPLYSGDKLFLTGPEDPFSVPPPLTINPIEMDDSGFQAALADLLTDPEFVEWQDADIERLAALLDAETSGQAQWDLADDEFAEDLTPRELDNAFLEACRNGELADDELEGYLLDRLPFQALEEAGLELEEFDPALDVPPMLQNDTAFWVGIYEVEESTYAACLLSVEGLAAETPEAHLAVCQIGDYPTALGASQTLLEAAQQGGLEQCLAAAETMGRSHGEIETVWTEGQGVPLPDDMAVGLATHANHLASDLDL